MKTAIYTICVLIWVAMGATWFLLVASGGV